MKLRGGRVFLDVKQAGYLLMRLFLEHIQVEDRSASVGQFGHKLHQYLFRQLASTFRRLRFIHYVRQMIITDYQLIEALLATQIVDGLCHHHARHPRSQRTFATKGEIGKDLDETVVQHIVGFIDIAHITIAHGQHLAGIKGVQLFSSSIITCPTPFNQLYFTIQYQYLTLRTLPRVFCLLDAASIQMLQSKI